MPCDDCLSRREFLTRGTLAVAGAAALVSACGDGQFGPVALAPAGNANLTIKVSSIPQLGTVGQFVKVGEASEPIVVKRTGVSIFFAVSAVCTHQGCETDIVGAELQCPCHGAVYDANGTVVRQPSSGSATDLPTYTTAYDPATDTLTIS